MSMFGVCTAMVGSGWTVAVGCGAGLGFGWLVCVGWAVGFG